MKEHGIIAKKRFGQNFLIDRRVLERIIKGADISKDDLVLEIGPGIGTLTQALCEAAGHVIAVEIDRDMLPVLDENLAYYDNYEIINDDVLKLDLAGLISDRAPDAEHVKVAANLPYYITTPIIMELLESRLPISSITVMVQKEVADRMQAAPGSSDYGALSLAVQYYAEAKITANVPPNCFIPRPGVDSAVITLNCYDSPPVQVSDDRYISRERAEQAIIAVGLGTDIRGERLSLSQFAKLSDSLKA